MRHPVRILGFHFDAIGPAFRPIRPHRYNCSNWDLAVIFFPLFHALEPQRVIRIGGCLTVYIDYDERQDHFLGRSDQQSAVLLRSAPADQRVFPIDRHA